MFGKKQKTTVVQKSQWTVDTLRDFVIRLFDDAAGRFERTEAHMTQLREAQRDALNIAILSVEREIKAATAAARDALIKAEIANEKRFDGMNEFREALGDQQKTFATRAELTLAIERLSERLQDISDRVNVNTGRGAGLNQGWGYLIALVVMVGGLIAIFANFHKLL